MDHDQFDPPDVESKEEYHDFDHANWIIPLIIIITLAAAISLNIYLSRRGY